MQKKNTNIENISKKKIFLFSLIIIFFFALVFLIVGEIIARQTYTCSLLHPRYLPSKKYGLVAPKNMIITHKSYNPDYKVTYTTNKLGNRGEFINFDNRDKPNVVFLGDSYTFGIGVEDGKEFASVVQKNLKDKATIINQSCGGWGLTTQSKFFNDYGLKYNPKICTLVFCGNDPADCIDRPVAYSENNELKFKDLPIKFEFLKKYLSRSIFQKLVLTRFVIYKAYKLIRKRKVANSLQDMRSVYGSEDTSSNNYNAILNAFVDYLNAKNIKFVVTSICYLPSKDKGKGENIISQLEEYPKIYKNVKRLEKEGKLIYLDAKKWFKPIRKHFTASKVGHYDETWNKIMGDSLTVNINKMLY